MTTQFYDLLRLDARKNPWSQQVDFLLTHHVSGEPHRMCGPLEFVPMPEGELIAPTFRLHGSEAQQLMDMLWDCGLRPTQGNGSIGQLDAVQRHLADMRSIAFKHLGMKSA